MLSGLKKRNDKGDNVRDTGKGQLSLLSILINLLRLGLTAAVIALAVLGGMHLLEGLEQEEPPRTFPRGNEDNDLALLPMKRVDARDVLGKSPHEVRALLGEPESQGPSSQVYSGPPRLIVRYTDNSATSISVLTRNAGMNQRQVRRWMHLPTEGRVEIEGVRYQVLAADRDEVVVERLPQVPNITTVVERRRRYSSRQLLEQFPEISTEFAAECSREAIGAGALFCLNNADARLLYDLDENQDVRVLTILDPPQASTLEECRAFLRDAFPDSELVAVVDEPGLFNRYFSAPGKRFAAIWSDSTRASRPSCAIVACVESDDATSVSHSPCLPRGD